MSLIRFRKRVQIDANKNLYVRDPNNPTQFMIVGNILTPNVPDLPAAALVDTIRYRKTVRIDGNDDLFIKDPANPTQFIKVGDKTGFSVPGAPTGLIGTPTDTTISVAFTAPVNDGNSVITSYQYSLDAGDNWSNFVPSTDASPGIITGLTALKTYNVIVRAVNAVGPGAASTSVEVTTTA